MNEIHRGYFQTEHDHQNVTSPAWDRTLLATTSKKISQVGLFHSLALTKEHREPVLEHAASQQCR